MFLRSFMRCAQVCENCYFYPDQKHKKYAEIIWRKTKQNKTKKNPQKHTRSKTWFNLK